MADTNSDNSNFKGLVSSISDTERQTMLDKIKKPAEDKESSGSSVVREEETPAQILIAKSREMSIFQRLWFRIKSLLTNTPFENVINAYLVSRIASGVEREFGGLMSSRKQLFLNTFYEKISQLKIAADFFMPLLQPFEDNPDYFYVVLGSVVMPDISLQIDSESDPKQYPYTKELNNEMRASLLHKMENIEDNIPSQTKTVMYASVRSVEWLRQFVKLPFDKLMAKFRINEDGSREVAFSQVPNELAAFARLFSDYRPLTTEILQSLHMVQQQRYVDMDSPEADNFMSSAQSQSSVISSFADTVPVKSMASVVYENSLYKPDPVSGGEDWLVRYRSQQKVIFDRRWNKWLHEYKKYHTKLKIEAYFNYSSVPQFPYRPWETVFGTGMHFDYSMTLGFLYYYFKNVYAEYQRSLNFIALEGDFSINENRQEFTDVTNEMMKISTELDSIASTLSAGGEVGQLMAKYDSPASKNKNSIERINVVLGELNKRVLDVINSFGKSSRSLENILVAITGEKITSYYGPLTNYTKIQGKDNREFREKIGDCRMGVANSYEILSELEALDQENYD